MTKRVNPQTLLCINHGVLGCQVCMIDDFWDWLQEQKERRAQAKKERRETSVDERFDLGGEG